jgi:phosphoribosyl 1,2-cyclic phosphodiesterase
MKGFCTLASGSKGNSLYFGSDKTRVLIDVGLSVKALKDKLEEIQVPIDSIDAVLITHEHSDHIKGLEQFVKQYDVPVIANHETAKAICDLIKVKPRFKIFCTGEQFQFNDLVFKPFSVQHDTIDPVGFILQLEKFKLGLCTDLGCVTSTILHALKELDYLILEANHKIDLVHASSRPDVYKQRVLSRLGHLSNDMTAKVIESVYHQGLKKVFLAHLSEECNTPEIALEMVKTYLDEKEIQMQLQIAHQEQISEFIAI